MYKHWSRILTTTLALIAFAPPTLASDPGVSLIGVGSVAGMARDLSGFKGQACQLDDPTNCIDKATLGGFGSGMTYTGHDDVFIAVNDRGPFDGRVAIAYPTRFHFFHI